MNFSNLEIAGRWKNFSGKIPAWTGILDARKSIRQIPLAAHSQHQTKKSLFIRFLLFVLSLLIMTLARATTRINKFTQPKQSHTHTEYRNSYCLMCLWSLIWAIKWIMHSLEQRYTNMNMTHTHSRVICTTAMRCWLQSRASDLFLGAYK